MKRMCAEHTVAVMVGLVTAEMISSLLVGCASSPSRPSWRRKPREDSGRKRSRELLCRSATGALIDDMSASSISLTPPSCGRRVLGTQFPPGRSPSDCGPVDSLELRK